MNEDTLDEIVDLVRSLGPAERQILLRRLRVSGLLPPEETITDRNRLQVAPALGPVRRKPSAPTPGSGQNASSTGLRLRMAGSPPERGATPGRVVIGPPDKDASEPAPHDMAPLPGRAPERPIVLIFDGGSKGNPGLGYGSYALQWPGQPQQLVQLQFGDGMTNNEAEYDTLIAALAALLKRLRAGGVDPQTARLDVRGDSQLVVNQVAGGWKCNEERLRNRRDRVQALLREFGDWRLTHHARENSVRVLGH
jgi:ribonuclease HI